MDSIVFFKNGGLPGDVHSMSSRLSISVSPAGSNYHCSHPVPARKRSPPADRSIQLSSSTLAQIHLGAYDNPTEAISPDPLFSLPRKISWSGRLHGLRNAIVPETQSDGEGNAQRDGTGEDVDHCGLEEDVVDSLALGCGYGEEMAERHWV
jgi:hypothetical protein